MGGEAVREAGILVLVFAPMYELFELINSDGMFFY
jgi:hypothetical protein